MKHPVAFILTLLSLAVASCQTPEIPGTDDGKTDGNDKVQSCKITASLNCGKVKPGKVDWLLLCNGKQVRQIKKTNATEVVSYSRLPGNEYQLAAVAYTNHYRAKIDSMSVATFSSDTFDVYSGVVDCQLVRDTTLQVKLTPKRTTWEITESEALPSNFYCYVVQLLGTSQKLNILTGYGAEEDSAQFVFSTGKLTHNVKLSFSAFPLANTDSIQGILAAIDNNSEVLAYTSFSFPATQGDTQTLTISNLFSEPVKPSSDKDVTLPLSTSSAAVIPECY